ncbi:MAG: ubiquinone/menaquinone biosynthesis methyltransferase [Fimbriimonadaceae bacterium]
MSSSDDVIRPTGPDPKRVQAMFGRIAKRYDLLNGLMSAGRHHQWRRAAVEGLKLKRGDSVLDSCSGTGDFLPPLRQAIGLEGKLFAADFSAPMLSQANNKDANACRSVADALALPFQDEQFDALTIGWGLRNTADPAVCLCESRRVLKPGGRLAVLDMCRPIGLGKLAYAAYARTAPLLGRLSGDQEAYRYLPESASKFLSATELADAFRHSGFADVKVKLFAFGTIALHIGTRPN